jgi:cytochrome c-type biogenesis protein CcmE
MQRVIFLIAVSVLLVSCNSSVKNEKTDSQADTQEAVIAATVEEVLAQPADYEGKEVELSGMVTHVCRHGGQKCFVLGEDGETQIRIVPGGDIDEFKIDLEGSTVAFTGTFQVLNTVAAEEHIADHESKEHHDEEMAHTEAEKAEYFIEATEFKEVTQ